MDKERVGKFKRVVEQSTGDFVVLITQVDPDALGSAKGMKKVLDSIVPDRDVVLVYCGKISHPQNQAIVSEFGLLDEMQHIEGFSILDAHNIILVDSSSVHDSRVPSELLPLDPLVAIDHHASDLPDEDEGHFFWVESVGSAATLIVELGQQLGVDFAGSSAPLLALGIYTDTDALAGASARDRDAYGVAADQTNEGELKRLINFQLPTSYFDVLTSVLGTVEVYDGRLFAHAGWIKGPHEDYLAIIADELGRRADVDMVFVSALIAETHIAVVKARSSDINTDLNEFLGKTFGRDVAGAKRVSGGAGKGGATLSLDLHRWALPGTEPQQEALVVQNFRICLFGDYAVQTHESSNGKE